MVKISVIALFRSESSEASAVVTKDATISAPPEEYPELTLHCYDHCPFCVRVYLALGWKRIPYETKVYGYGANALSKWRM